MKDYKRLTDRVTAEMLRNTEEESWDSDNLEAQCYIRLAELEDKIERGELVDRNEYLDRLMAAKDISGMTDKEIEFFAKHNARVRENADAEIARLTAENQRLREEAAEQKSIAEHEHATQMEWFQIACDYKAENAEVRKQSVIEFAERVKMAFYYEFDELIPSIMADKIDELVEEVCRE